MNTRAAADVACALVLAVLLAYVGPVLIDRLDRSAERTAATSWAIEQAQTEQRREAAARAVCGPQALSSWTHDGQLLCTSRHGRTQLTAQVQP